MLMVLYMVIIEQILQGRILIENGILAKKMLFVHKLPASRTFLIKSVNNDKSDLC